MNINFPLSFLLIILFANNLTSVPPEDFAEDSLSVQHRNLAIMPYSAAKALKRYGSSTLRTEKFLQEILDETDLYRVISKGDAVFLAINKQYNQEMLLDLPDVNLQIVIMRSSLESTRERTSKTSGIVLELYPDTHSGRMRTIFKPFEYKYSSECMGDFIRELEGYYELKLISGWNIAQDNIKGLIQRVVSDSLCDEITVEDSSNHYLSYALSQLRELEDLNITPPFQIYLSGRIDHFYNNLITKKYTMFPKKVRGRGFVHTKASYISNILESHCEVIGLKPRGLRLLARSFSPGQLLYECVANAYSTCGRGEDLEDDSYVNMNFLGRWIYNNLLSRA